MPISGILAVCRPDDLPRVQRSIDRQEWADVHYTTPDGRLVVTIEGDTTDTVMGRLLELQRMPGVVMAAMAEHWVEEEERPRAGAAGNGMDDDPIQTGENR